MPGKRYQKIVTPAGTELELISKSNPWSPEKALTLVNLPLPWGEAVVMTAKRKPTPPPKPWKPAKVQHPKWARWDPREGEYVPAPQGPRMRVPLVQGKRKKK